MKTVVLSPHLDDAVLSCGGLLSRLGPDAEVLTLCAGRPKDGPLSPVATALHYRMGNPDDPVGVRIAENERALARLRVRGVNLSHEDAAYRYDDPKMLFCRGPDGDRLDPVFVDRLCADIQKLHAAGTVTLCAPLGVGNHIDHLLTHGAAAQLATLGYDVMYYEDFPYVLRPENLEAALPRLGAPKAELVPLGEDHLAAKIEAMACYVSQARLFFSAELTLEQVREHLDVIVRHHCAQIDPPSGPCERFWRQRPT